MAKRMILMLAVMVVVIGGIIGFKLFGRHMMNVALASQRPAPVTVSTAEARELTWEPSLHAVGTFAAIQGIMVSAQLDAPVTKIAFESGAVVKAGDLLVQQDVSTEQAQLAAAEAAAALGRLSLERARQLREQGSNAPIELDTAVATFDQAQANVAAIKSVIEKKTIRAPFAGRLGIRQVNLGQFVRSGAAIVPLHALDPIYFNFSLPQQNAGRVTQGQAIGVTIDAFPGDVFTGTVTAVNPNVDDVTRTLQFQATLKNADARMQPGMFGSLEVRLPTSDRVVTLPLSALVYNPYGDAVYVVQKKGSGTEVRQQFVTSGAKRGDQVAITKGVTAGDVVVTSGQLKLRNGSAILVDNTVRPADSATPRPDHP
jgi:membrane fusion protein, multidrug efflux system